MNTTNTTIGKGITITGSIQAEESVIIAGTVHGDVLASDHDVTVEPGAQADIASPKLALDDGATFNGSVEPAKTDAAIRVATYRNRNDVPVAG
jgi:cytoskeletal protein CcmA (bactofilin family)